MTNSERPKDQPRIPESEREEAKKRILAMVEKSPNDFPDFDIQELTDEDFGIEEQYQSRGKLSLEELQSRRADLDINKPLNKSQRMLVSYIITKVTERFSIDR